MGLGDILSKLQNRPLPVTRQLDDDSVEETLALEEELNALSGRLPPDDPLTEVYIRKREYLRSEYVKERDRSLRDPEATSRNERTYRAKRRRMFAYLVRKRKLERKALCLSGGGIRSATFSLGVVQWLGQHGLLKQFDFLSTVSGGGYLGSWLTAWIHRHQHGIAGVERDLADAEPGAVVRLREYSNYLAPKFGLLTADTWTLAITYIRNLLINWMAFLPFLAAVVTAPQIAVAWAARVERSFDGPLWAIGIGAVILGWVTAVMGLSLPSPGAGPQQLIRRPRLWIVSSERQFLAKVFGPFIAAGLLITVGWHGVIGTGADGAYLFELPWWARFVRSRSYWEWAVAGAVFHVAAMTPALVRLFQERVTRLVMQGFVVRKDVSANLAWRFLLENLPSLKGVWEFIVRILAVVVVCGGLGGVLCRVLIDIHAHFTAGVPDALHTTMFVLVAPPAFWSVILIAGTLFIALISVFTTDYEREWYARAGAWMLIAIVGWLAIVSLSLFGPNNVLMAWNSRFGWISSIVTAGSGLIAVLGGGGGASSGGKDNRNVSPMQAVKNAMPAVAAPIFLAGSLSLLALGATLLVGWVYSMTPDAAQHGLQAVTATREYLFDLMNERPVKVAVLSSGVFLAIALVVDLVTDLSVFSLHALYRDRLVRAYLAASRVVRKPNPFTGIDPNDNLPLTQLRPGAFGQCDVKRLAAFVRSSCGDDRLLAIFKPGQVTEPDDVRDLVVRLIYAQSAVVWRIGRQDAKIPLDPDEERILLEVFNTVLVHPEFCEATGVPDGEDPVQFNRGFLENRRYFEDAEGIDLGPRLFPVINTALNLVGGDELAWQQRKAESFSFTPLHAGASSVGYRRTIWNDRSREVRYYGQGISVGTAMTISGAAANPNMGYHSSPAVTFLLTLFNARLGTWLGNPGDGRHAWRRAPQRMLPRILDEAFGLTNRTSKYLNLSDGGHFENLGIYEMVRRRCSLIVVVDAGQDGDYSFEDLGNAINKVRVDFGISIDFPERPRIHRLSEGSSAHTAVGKIKYSAVHGYKDGVLLYIKPALSLRDPVDVLAYASQAQQFPHEPTSNQFFTERQFESYRMLGWQSLESLFSGAPAAAPPTGPAPPPPPPGGPASPSAPKSAAPPMTLQDLVDAFEAATKKRVASAKRKRKTAKAAVKSGDAPAERKGFVL